MNDELFTTNPTPPTPLQKARARLAKAEKEVERIEKLNDEQGPETYPAMLRAEIELASAKGHVEVEENRELERLRAARKPA